jgi:uncharacterized membrane protein
MWERRLQNSIEINAPTEAVFSYVDDIRNTGWHMTKSSMPLMGSKLQLEILLNKPSGVGATYRWFGKVMGFKIDFSETVTKWVPNQERVWKTIGNPKILIIEDYEMRFLTEPLNQHTRLTFEIQYNLPKAFFWRAIALLLADWYSKWCLKNMCEDAKRALEKSPKI